MDVLLKTERTLYDGDCKPFHVRVELLGGKALELMICHLANRAQSSVAGVATALGGAVRVTLLKSPGGESLK